MILHLTLLPEHQSAIFPQCLSVQHANLAKAFQQCGRVCACGRGYARRTHTEVYLQGVMHVEVVAMVTQPEQVRSDVTNTFHFVFSTTLDEASSGSKHGHGQGHPRKLKRVLPGTREEALSILQFAPESDLQDS